MTWSYSGNPASSTKDLVRFLIGDTSPTAVPPDPVPSFVLVSDEEINAVLSYQSNPVYAAAAICDSLSAKFSVQVDRTIGATSVRSSQRADAYAKLATRLRAGGAGNLPGGDGSGERVGDMVVGGLDVSENEALREDSSTEQPSFNVGQDDKPGVPLNRTVNDWIPEQ